MADLVKPGGYAARFWNLFQDLDVKIHSTERRGISTLPRSTALRGSADV